MELTPWSNNYGDCCIHVSININANIDIYMHMHVYMVIANIIN